MKQTVRLTESELKEMVMNAINEQLNETDEARTMLGSALGGVWQGIKNWRNDPNVKQTKQARSAMKADMKSATNDYNTIAKMAAKDEQYLKDMETRYSQYFNNDAAKKVAATIPALINTVNGAKTTASTAMNTARGAYDTANTEYGKALDARGENLTNRIGGLTNRPSTTPAQPTATDQPTTTNQQPDAGNTEVEPNGQIRMISESIDRAVNKVINEMLKK